MCDTRGMDCWMLSRMLTMVIHEMCSSPGFIGGRVGLGLQAWGREHCALPVGSG